jgi:hypothetical protein
MIETLPLVPFTYSVHTLRAYRVPFGFPGMVPRDGVLIGMAASVVASAGGLRDRPLIADCHDFPGKFSGPRVPFSTHGSHLEIHLSFTHENGMVPEWEGSGLHENGCCVKLGNGVFANGGNFRKGISPFCGGKWDVENLKFLADGNNGGSRLGVEGRLRLYGAATWQGIDIRKGGL